MDIVIRKSGSQESGARSERSVVRVLPTSDAIRKHIKHPLSKRGFLAEGSVEWPFDQFTKRRIADGDVVIEPKKPAESKKAKEAKEVPAKEKPRKIDFPSS